MNMIHSENPDNPFLSKLELTELYSNSLIDQFCSVLINSIGGKDFLLLVIGESKSGKTTLLSKLTSQIEQDVKPCQLKIRKNNDLPLNTNKHPAFLYKTENNQVIIMDDAHELNSQELAIILKNAWDSDKDTNQLILFCEPRINTTISSLLKEMPKKASVNKLYIPCFDKKQTESYLNHYLEISNLSEKFSFSDNNIKKIFEESNGLPGKINHAAKEIFSEISSSTINTNQTKSKYIPLFAFLIIFFFLTIATYFIFKKPSIISIPNETVTKDSHKSITKKIQQPDNTDKIVKINPAQDLNTKQHFNEKTIIESTINEKGNLKTEPDQTKIADTDKAIVSQQPVIKPARVITKPQISKPVIIETTEKESILKTTNWILTQEPLLFTIQIMAAKDDDAIDRFLKLNTNNQNQIAYYKMNFKKDIWYKFILGKYDTLEKAKTAIHNLPEKLKSLGPWPRQFRSIQNEVNEFIKNSEGN